MKQLKKILVSMLALFVVFTVIGIPTSIVAEDAANVEILNDTAFSYHGNGGEGGTWGVDKGVSQLYNGDSHWTNRTSGSNDGSVYFEFEFIGTGVELYGNKEAAFGKVDVFIDGAHLGVYDGYNPTKLHQQLLWNASGLENTQHTLKAVMRNDKNENSKGYNLLIDYAKITKEIESVSAFTIEKGKSFKLPMERESNGYTWGSSDDNIVSVTNGVIQGEDLGEAQITVKENNVIVATFAITVINKVLGPIDEDNSYIETDINDNVIGTGDMQFSYHGSWGIDSNIAGLYRSDAHWSDVSMWGGNARNHYYTFQFTGKKIAVYGSLQAKLGIYDVYIDDKFMGKIDAYSAVEKKQQLYFESPVLEDKGHTLKVVMTGQKNAASKGPSGFVDFVKVTHNYKNIYPTKISVSGVTDTLEQGFSIAPSVSYEPQETNQKELSWEVDEEMIKVNEDGSLTPLKSGTTTIVAVAKIKNGVIKSEPVTLNVIEGNKLGKIDFTSKNRRVQPENYDKYGAVIDKEDSMTLWANDAGNTAAILLTKEEAIDASLKADNFVNENGDTLDASNIEVNFQKYISTYTGSNWIPTNPRPFVPGPAPTGNRADAADVIYESQMKIPAQTAQPIWIKVKTPKGTKPGIYKGDIVVTLAEGETLSIQQTVEVLDITLEDDSDYYLNLWQYPYSSASYYNVEPFSQEHLSIVENQMLPYLDAQGKTGTASIVDEPWYHQTYCDYPSMVKWMFNDGKWEFDYSDFDVWVDFLLNTAKVSYVECYSIVPWQNIIRYTEDGVEKEQHAAPGTAQWEAAWRPFLESFTKHLDEKGWYDEIIIAMDERPMVQMEAALNLIESIHNKDGKTFKVGGAVGSYNEAVWDRLFTVTPHIANINSNISMATIRQVAEDRRKEGKLTSIYTMIGDYPGMFSLSDPGEAAWTIWFAESCNTDGFLRWAYDAWVKDPLVDNAHPYFESGDMFFVYPGDYEKEATKPRTSPRFELMSESIKDVRKLRQMSKENKAFDDSVNALVTSVKSFYGQATNNGIGTAGFKVGRDQAKINLSNEVNRLHNETVSLAREYAKQSFVSADYSLIEKVLNDIKTLEIDHYTTESLTVLDEAVNSIVYGYSVANQDKVNRMGETLKNAYLQLEYKKADYTKVDDAIKMAGALNPKNYKDFSGVIDAIKAVVRNYNINEQSKVDAMAEAIENAVRLLEKKPGVQPRPEKPEKPVKPDKPTKPTKPTKPNVSSQTKGEKVQNTVVVFAQTEEVSKKNDAEGDKKVENKVTPKNDKKTTNEIVTKSETPKATTSTSSNTMLYVGLAAIVVAGGAFFTLKKKR